jgi:hypothetical protein
MEDGYGNIRMSCVSRLDGVSKISGMSDTRATCSYNYCYVSTVRDLVKCLAKAGPIYLYIPLTS